MKNLFALCLFLSVSLFPAYGQTGDYQLVWQDNFDEGALDQTAWTVEVNGNGGGNNELEYYRAENVTLGIEPVSGDSCLILTARQENYGGHVCTSGRLNTASKMYFKYGKIEARIKLPQTGNGLWPAFWMMGNNYSQPGVGWPKCGEIDIMEMGSSGAFSKGTQDKYYSGYFHWWTTSASYTGQADYGQAKTSSYGLQDDFHLWTLVWDPNTISMYLDQDKYPDESPYVSMGTAGIDIFNLPFFVIFNLAIGGNFTGITGNANIGQITAFAKAPDGEPKMYIDYVRVYQKGDDGESYTGPALKNPTAIRQVASQQFNVSCNDGVLSVEGEATPAKMVLYNPAGSIMMQVNGASSANVSNLAAGVYILKIQPVSGNEEVYKIMINV